MSKIQLTDFANKVLEARYLKKDADGKVIEKPEDMFRRVAHAVARAELKYNSLSSPEVIERTINSEIQAKVWEDKFYDIMTNLEFMPNSPTLFNAGLTDKGTLSACLSGDSIVRCCAGSFTIKDLAEGKLGREFVVYTIKDDGKIGLSRAFDARRTGNKEVFRVNFDDGSSIDATNDHLIMLRDGNYCSVAELKIGQSVMPFNYYDNYGYLVGFEGISEKPVAAHKLVVKEHGTRLSGEDAWNYGSGVWNGPILSGSDHPNYRHDLDSSEIVRMHDEQKLIFREIARIMDCSLTTVLCRYHSYKEVCNHKVVSILSIGLQEVYDLSVEDTHNFAVNNVFVHNCFKFDVEDSMEEIMSTATKCAMVMKFGGGIGIELSQIRPKGYSIASTHGKACGPISVMGVIHEISKMITQGGKREGAMMAILNCVHPDVEEFIDCKLDNNKFNAFNISVAVTNDFMKAVENDSDWNLVWDGKVVKTIRAKYLFGKIVTNAHRNGDPGLYFIDTAERFNPTPHLGKLTGTNPCGEVPLLSNEPCNLGSLNLAKFVCNNFINIPDDLNEYFDGAIFNKIDWRKLYQVVKLAIRFLDDVIDINYFPIPEITEACLRTRKIGLGVMGWADTLIKLNISYNNEEAIKLAEQVMGFINKVAEKYSQELAIDRGPYPAQKDKNCMPEFNDELWVRNATRTCCAPTGTCSIIAGCSSGIEPIFALYMKRTGQAGMDTSEVYVPLLERLAQDNSLKPYDEDTIEVGKQLAMGKKLSEIDFESGGKHWNVSSDIVKVFITANEISYDWHIKMQSAFQKHTNLAVSKTVNMSNAATIEDVRNAYFLAWQLGCKGTTIYRDGSREGQVLSTVKSAEKSVGTLIRERAKVTEGETTLVHSGCGHCYITVNSDKLGFIEVFSNIGTVDDCKASQLEAICRMISLTLRSGIGLEPIIKQLNGIKCNKIAWEDDRSILSCADGIAYALSKYVGGEIILGNTNSKCPDCGSFLVAEEGCYKCYSCGYTKC